MTIPATPEFDMDFNQLQNTILLDEFFFKTTTCIILDNSPGAHGLKVQNRSSRGHDYAILKNNPIEADGYLVAWQYFTRSSGRPCLSYAAIWQRVDQNKLKLMSKTLLQTDQTLLNTVNFHYLNEVVRVKTGDFPAIFVGKSTKCSGNLVSFDNNGDKAFIGRWGVPPIGYTVSDYDHMIEGRGVSIRPYIAGELSNIALLSRKV